MSVPQSFPLKLVLGLTLTVAIDTVVQLAWKVGIVSLPELSFSIATMDAVLRHPAFYLMFGLLLVQLCNWLIVLDQADVSFAQPFTSMSRVSVCVASAFYLGERVTIAQALGIVMVCAGAWCISRTDRKTPASAALQPDSRA